MRGINLFKEILSTQAAKQQNELKEVKLVVLIKQLLFDQPSRKGNKDNRQQEHCRVSISIPQMKVLAWMWLNITYRL